MKKLILIQLILCFTVFVQAQLLNTFNLRTKPIESNDLKIEKQDSPLFR